MCEKKCPYSFDKLFSLLQPKFNASCEEDIYND